METHVDFPFITDYSEFTIHVSQPPNNFSQEVIDEHQLWPRKKRTLFPTEIDR